MPVSVMRVREMRVFMGHRFVAVPMTMLRAGCHWLIVLMLMVRIVDMHMVVLHRFVCVFVAVLFGQV
jgi:hypothetical protein